MQRASGSSDGRSSCFQVRISAKQGCVAVRRAVKPGELTGINMVLQNVFRALGALLGGVAFAWSGSYRPGFAVVALFFAVSAVILSRVRFAPVAGQQTG